MADAPKKRPGPETAKLLANVKMIVPKDDASKKAIPGLLDVMLPIWKDSIMTRQPAKMMISADGGSWRCTIECPTEGLQATFMLDSLATLLVEVDAILQSGKTSWGMSWQRRKKHLPTIDDLIQ